MAVMFTGRSGKLSTWTTLYRPFTFFHQLAITPGLRSRLEGSMCNRYSSSAVHVMNQTRSCYRQEMYKNMPLQDRLSFKTYSHFVSAHLHSSAVAQAGHNKWSKIKRKKAVADMERSRYTHKYVQKIISAIRIGGSSNPEKNLQLASVIEQAKAVGVPKTNIESAIEKANSKMSSSSTESVLFDARGPSGYSLLIEAVTDNIKRTRPQVRTLLEKNGGILGETGSSSFNFEHRALIRVPSSAIKTDPLELAIEIGAEDVITVNEEDRETEDGSHLKQADGGGHKEKGVTEKPSQEESNAQSSSMSYQFKCNIEDLRQVMSSLKENGIECFTTSFEYLPKTFVYLNHKAFDRATKFVDLLCDHDDVVEVFDNFVLEEEQS